MEIVEKTATRIVLSMELGELLIINNALNEVCNALPRASFETRMGVSLAQATSLLETINSLLPSS